MYSFKEKYKFLLKNRKITKIQSLFRVKKAKRLVIFMRKVHSAIKIQKLVRVFFAKRKTRKQKDFFRKFKLIQVFWRNRFSKLVIALKKIQRKYRKYHVLFFYFIKTNTNI